MTPKRFYLYEYTNQISGKRYIGVTGDLERRDNEHRLCHRSGLAFSRAVRKHGFENFHRRVLAVFDDADAAAYHEQAAIMKLGTLAPDGYNLTAGAPYTRYNGGGKSDETRARIGAVHRKLWADPEYHARMSTINTGRVRTDAQKAAASARASVRWSDPEYRATMSAALKGKAGRPKGMKVSDETRARMSQAQRESRARRKAQGH